MGPTIGSRTFYIFDRHYRAYRLGATRVFLGSFKLLQ